MMGAKISLAKDEVAGNLIQFNENGAWCWYQDPRLVVDPTNDTLLISSVVPRRESTAMRDPAMWMW